MKGWKECTVCGGVGRIVDEEQGFVRGNCAVTPPDPRYPNYKVGDEVIFNKPDSRIRRLTVGGVYTITQVSKYSPIRRIWVTDDTGQVRSFSATSFRYARKNYA